MRSVFGSSIGAGAAGAGGLVAALGAAAALLALLALAQLAVAFRSDIVAVLPQARPALGQLCRLFRCTVGWPTRADLLAVVGTELQLLPGASALELTAIVRNRGPMTLELPAIELTLSDTLNRTVARRIFTPLEYLAGDADPRSRIEAGLAAGADLTVVFTDLEGFTAFTHHEGDEAASRLLGGHYAAVDDLVAGITDYVYSGAPCCCIYHPESDRHAYLVEKVKAAEADGVLFWAIRFCEPDAFDRPQLAERLKQEGIPAFTLEMDLATGNFESVKTRAEAFCEMIGGLEV